MDSTFEHIGMYNFMGIFGTGAINIVLWIMSYFITTDKNIFEFIEIINIKIENYIWLAIFLFIILGYYVGTVLHELGRFLQDYTKLFGEDIFENYFNDKKCTNTERKELLKFLKKDLTIKAFNFKDLSHDEIRFLYDYCNNYIKGTGKTIRNDRTQSIFGFSRGMFVGSLSHLFIYFICVVYYKIFNRWSLIITVFLGICVLLFFHRAKIYNVARVKNVFWMYYALRKGNVK